jgi:hypothetical protein
MLNLLGTLNYLEIIVAAIVYFMLGWVWYSFLFSKAWMREMGISKPNMTEEQQAEMYKGMMPAMLISLITAAILAMAIGMLQTAFASTGLIGHLFNGLFLWVAFVGGPTLCTTLYGSSKKVNLWAINNSYPLAGILLLNILMFFWA